MLKKFFFIICCLALVNLALAQSDKLKQQEAEGDTLLNRQDYAGALKVYAKILKAYKEKDQFYYSIVYKSAVSNYSIGHFDQALAQLEEFIPAYPNVPQAHLLGAFIYREKGDTDKQLIALEKGIALQPGNPELIKWRAMLYLDKEKFDSAKTDLKYLRAVQDDSEVETYLGFAYYNTNEKDSAMISLNKAIELDATYKPALMYAGSFALQEEAYDLALTYINLALRLDSKNPTAWFYKGVALVEKEKLDEGCSCLAKSLRLGSDDAVGYLKEYCYGEEN
ncbi:MAG TPA: tetratricopeptide repeat protein [Cyclobacteriaceae bacterium]